MVFIFCGIDLCLLRIDLCLVKNCFLQMTLCLSL